MTAPFILAQLSDPHIDLTPEKDGGLERAVTHLLELPFPIDAVLITGDMTDAGDRRSYARCKELLGLLDAPVYTVPGNHDNREAFLESFGPQGGKSLPGFAQYAVEDLPVRLIALDTHVPDESGGYLCEARLGWLEARLAEAPEKPTLLFMHHPPFAVGNHPLDTIGLENAAAFAEIVTRYPNIERILAGHTHTLTLKRFGGTLALTCPSVQTQMLIDFMKPERLEAITQPPACLLHVWREGSGIITEPSLIGEHGPLHTFYNGSRWVADYTGEG